MMKKNMVLKVLPIGLILTLFISCTEIDKSDTKLAKSSQDKVELSQTKKAPVIMSQGACIDCHTTDEKGNLTFETIDGKLQMKKIQAKKNKN